MKAWIVIISCLLMVFMAGSVIGYNQGLKSQDPMKNRVADIIEETVNQGNALYDKGFESGERRGFEEGYLNCYQGLGLQWLGSAQRFLGFQKEYGNLHNTPWEKFTIEEKVVIAMYGGSGSKLEPEEVTEWSKKYGR